MWKPMESSQVLFLLSNDYSVQSLCCWLCLECREDSIVSADETCLKCPHGYVANIFKDTCVKLQVRHDVTGAIVFTYSDLEVYHVSVDWFSKQCRLGCSFNAHVTSIVFSRARICLYFYQVKSKHSDHILVLAIGSKICTTNGQINNLKIGTKTSTKRPNEP